MREDVHVLGLVVVETLFDVERTLDFRLYTFATLFNNRRSVTHIGS